MARDCGPPSSHNCKKIVIPVERSEGRDPLSRLHPGSRHGALLTQRLAGMTI